MTIESTVYLLLLCIPTWRSCSAQLEMLFDGSMIYCLMLSQVASFLLYLSDVEEGGETMFPFEVRWGNLLTSLVFHFL